MAVFIYQLITRVLVIAFLIAFASYFSTSFFQNPLSKVLIVILSFSFVFSAFGSFGASLVAYRLFNQVSALNFVRNLIFLIGSWFAIHFQMGAVGIAYAYMLSIIVNDIILFIIFFKNCMPDFFKVKSSIKIPFLKKLFKMGFTFTLSSLAIAVFGFVDIFTITKWTDAITLGVYQMILPTAAALNMLLGYAMGMLIPTTFAKFSKIKLKEIIIKSHSLMVYCFVPMMLAVCVYSSEIMKVLFNQESFLADWGLKILFLNQILFFVMIWNINILTGFKKLKDLIRISIIGAVLCVLGSIIGSYFFGAFGVMFAYTLTFFIIILFEKSILKRENLDLPFNQWGFKPIVAGILIFIAGIIIKILIQNLVLRLVIGLVGMAAIYLIIMQVFKINQEILRIAFKK